MPIQFRHSRCKYKMICSFINCAITHIFHWKGIRFGDNKYNTHGINQCQTTVQHRPNCNRVISFSFGDHISFRVFLTNNLYHCSKMRSHARNIFKKVNVCSTQTFLTYQISLQFMFIYICIFQFHVFALVSNIIRMTKPRKRTYYMSARVNSLSSSGKY